MATFAFRTASDLQARAWDLGVRVPFDRDPAALLEPLRLLGGGLIPNRFAVQPMEGFDGTFNGRPDELTFRRYLRYAGGGSGLIWFEATSVAPEGRSNPRQLWLHRRSRDAFARLVEQTRALARTHHGPAHEPYLVLQLTHSGRFSRPAGDPEPLATVTNPWLDRIAHPPRILDDGDLELIQDRFVQAARLAAEAGFDAVDIKACHGYLIADLLAARTREGSRWGGDDLDGRVRFLLETVERVRAEAAGLAVAVRLGVYDGLAPPHGFGTSAGEDPTPDLEEPLALVGRLRRSGCVLLNVTAGIARHNPWVGRPFERPAAGNPPSPEHPLIGVGRLLRLAAEVQQAQPDLPVVATGFSWLRQWLPQVGAAVVGRGEAALIGLGRAALACPDLPREVMSTGRVSPKKVCVTCSRCSDLMNAHQPTGCAVQDREIYGAAWRLLPFAAYERG
jgi:2,4-dienoyl-CoA reductase (NADPH2)